MGITDNPEYGSVMLPSVFTAETQVLRPYQKTIQPSVCLQDIDIFCGGQKSPLPISPAERPMGIQSDTLEESLEDPHQ